MADEAEQTNSTEMTTEPVTPADAAPPEAVETADEGTVLGGDAPAGDAGEGDASAEEPAASVVPEKYELTAPEGMKFDDEALAIADPVFRDLGLTNEAAQKLMPVAGEFAKRAGAAAIAQHELDKATQFASVKAAWLADAKKDEEIGGDRWGDSVSLSAKALDKLGFKEGHAFRSFLNETGLGNHPEMIRAMRRIGERVSDDTFERGGAPKNPPTSVADRWYSKEGTN